jgi:hypothetical protein
MADDHHMNFFGGILQTYGGNAYNKSRHGRARLKWGTG